MTWQEYNIIMNHLTKQFGEKKYNQEYIRSKWFLWKDKELKELSKLVEECLLFCDQKDIDPKKTSFDIANDQTKKVINEQSNRPVSEGYLESYLKSQNVSSLKELFEKQIKK